MYTNQSTCIERLRRKNRLKLHCLCESKGLLFDEEEKKLAVRLVLPRDIPEAG